MKKNYERNQLVISISFFFIILCFLFLVYIFTYRYRSYQVLDSILISENYIKLMITSKDLKMLRRSQFVLIDNQKLKMEIISIEKNILKTKGYYHDILLRVKTPKKYQDGDLIKITIYDQKKRMFHIFKSCWKE